MHWSCTWGVHYEKLMKSNIDLSNSSLANNAPTISIWLEPIIKAFSDLSSSRETAWGVAPIKFSEIKAYIDVFPQQDIERFILLLQATDNEYCKVVNKQNGTTSKSKHSSK